MPYTQFDKTKPDGTLAGTQLPIDVNANLLALRDSVIFAGFAGWDCAVSGGTAEKPTQFLYSEGTHRVRVTVAYGTSGNTNNKITSVTVDFSSDSGGSYDAVDSTTISYNSAGDVTATPGMGLSWLLVYQNLLYLLRVHETNTAPHSATNEATSNRLVIRDANGRFKAALPSAEFDVANKQFVEAATVANSLKIGGRTVHTSTAAPTGANGADGDLWFQREA